MAYNYPQNLQTQQPQLDPNSNDPNVLRQMWELARSGVAGFGQGLWGKNMTFEQWSRERERRKKGLPPSQYSNKNWLTRLIHRR
jgi:hypothetical protein